MGNHRGVLACADLLVVGKVKWTHLEGPSVELADGFDVVGEGEII